MHSLAQHPTTVLEGVLREEGQKREHLAVALSGAHAYGFPSPDSDFDLKAIHIDPTSRLLGLGQGEPHKERLEVIEGVEVDYSSNELKPVLIGILQGNGNYLERVLGPLPLMQSADLETLKPLVKKSLSKKVHRHYLGFAASQLRAFEAATPPTAKKLLYVLRTALTGAHALLTGEIVTDLTALADEHGLGDARDLIAQKLAGERVTLTPEQAKHWRGRADVAFRALASALQRSSLPEAAPNEEELDAWLRDVRKRRVL